MGWFLWCAYVLVLSFLCVCLMFVCVCVCEVSGQPWLRRTHPYKAGREPSFLLINLAPPPVLVGGIQHLYDVAGLKRQLPVRHGHMVPYRLSVDDRTSTYQLRKLEKKAQNIAYALPSFRDSTAVDAALKRHSHQHDADKMSLRMN